MTTRVFKIIERNAIIIINSFKKSHFKNLIQRFDNPHQNSLDVNKLKQGGI